MRNEHNLSHQMELLRDEVERTQGRIQNYDDLIFKIKGWAITLWIGAIGFAVNQKEPLIALAALPVLFAFWWLEAERKKYQQRHIVRMRCLERFINGTGGENEPSLKKALETGDLQGFVVTDPVGVVTHDLDERFREEYEEYFRFWRSFWKPSVRTLYIFLSVLTLAAAGLVWVCK